MTRPMTRPIKDGVRTPSLYPSLYPSYEISGENLPFFDHFSRPVTDPSRTPSFFSGETHNFLFNFGVTRPLTRPMTRPFFEKKKDGGRPHIPAPVLFFRWDFAIFSGTWHPSRTPSRTPSLF